MESRPIKKINLSLLKLPINSSRPNTADEHVSNIIDLTSDDDDDKNKEMKVDSNVDCNVNTSSSSNSTVTYTPERLFKDPSTPTKVSSTKRKYYSPNKKRMVQDRSPNKVTRNLDFSLESSGCLMDEDFSKLVNGLNDNTIFLIEIISQFLNDANLRSLLENNSLKLLEKCKEVKKPGMRLVCRLYWQQEQWYRWDKLKKISKRNSDAEIDDKTLHEAISTLIEHGYFDMVNCTEPNHGLNWHEIGQILNVNEVAEICKEFKLKTSNKGNSIDALKSYSQQKNITNYMLGSKSNNETRVFKVIGKKLGSCYRLAEHARKTLKELYYLMYLGIDLNILREKKLELEILNERTDKETYPSKNLPVDNASVVFKSREEFKSYMLACNIYDEFLSTTDPSKRRNLVKSTYDLYRSISEEEMTSYIDLPVWLYRFVPPYIYVGILEKGIADLKNGSKADIVLACKILHKLINKNVFKQHKKAEWYAEKALILDKLLSRAEEAGEVLLEGLSSNLHEQGKELLCPRALKIARRKTNPISDSLRLKLTECAKNDDILEKNIKGKHIYEVPMENYGKGKLRFKISTRTETLVMGAEEYCIHHYINKDASEYSRGEHWEGRIITTIFFLLFWDIIYANMRGLRGLFLSHYQRYPLDMFCDCFYTNRKSLIDERLMEIKNSTIGAVVERMQATWNSRPECELSDINRSIGWDNVKEVTSCLQPKRVAALCRRLARDYRYSHSGFPDLTLWNVDTHQIIFVEVKTDSDKPSMKQLQWMNYLKKHDMKAEFCYVGVNTTRNQSRNVVVDADDDE